MLNMLYFILIVTLVPNNYYTTQDTTISKHVDMEEIEITAKREPISIVGGEVHIDLLHFIMDTDANALDVLRRIPGITINERTKEITYHNKPIRFKLNGVNQSNMYSILQSLPAHLLKTFIERRDALTGDHIDPENPIIDIVLTKKRLEGFIGGLGTYAQGEEYSGKKFDGTGIISFMTKYFTITINETYNMHMSNKKEGYDSIAYTTNNYYYASNRYTDEKNNKLTNNININYLSAKEHSLSLNFNNNVKYNRPSIKQNNYGISGLESISYQNNKSNDSYYSGNIHFQSKSTEKGSTQLRYSIMHYNLDYKSRYNNEYRDTTLNIAHKQLYSGTQQHAMWTTTFKTINNKLIVNIGTNASFAKTDYNLLQHAKDPKKTRYKEFSIVPNINFTLYLDKKNILTSSLKEDYSSYQLNELTAEQTNNSSWRFTPYFSWYFIPNTKYNSLLYFTSITERPSFFRLSPRLEYVSDKYYIAGNPSLKPKNIYYMTWRQTLKQKFVFNISVQKHKNLMVEMLLAENDIVTQTYMNTLDINGLVFNTKLPFSLWKNRVNITFSGTMMFYKVDKLLAEYTPISSNCRTGNTQLDVTYQPNNRWYFSGTYHRTIPAQEYFVKVPSFEYSHFNAQYLCNIKRDMRISLTVIDPFNSSLSTYQKHSMNTIYYTRYEPVTRAVQLGFSWNFRGGKDFNRRINKDDANRDINRFRE